MQSIRANAALLGGEAATNKPFPDVLAEVQAYISRTYAAALQGDGQEQRSLIKSYISKYLTDHALGVEDVSHDELCELLYGEMAGFSFLTKYMFDPEVEEININQWADVKITCTSGEIVQAKERFNSPQHAIDVIRRLLHQSNMILDNAQPVVVGHLASNIRVTVMGDGVIDSDKGVAASIRIVNPRKLTREDFIRNETATGEMLDFLAAAYRYGASTCITGATSSGKTTLMSYLLSLLPDNKRLVTIEQGTREFDLTKKDENGLVLNNVIHLVTRFSDDPHQNITQTKLLETALTINPDYIAMCEMKGAEAYHAVSAANTGHATISTTHCNSCRSTYNRIVTLCKLASDMGDTTLYSLATEAFPVVAFIKKLEDNTRRIMEITECEVLEDGRRSIRTLYRFVATDTQEHDHRVKIIGHYEKVNDPSEHLQQLLRENGMPLSLLSQFTATA